SPAPPHGGKGQGNWSGGRGEIGQRVAAAAAAVQAGAGAEALGQRQSGAAKAAFGGEAADIPVRAAAAGAMDHLALALGDMVAGLAALSLTASAIAQPAAAPSATPDFSADAFRAHVTFLADDLLEGREAGTRGYDIASRYVATQFAALGLQPAGADGGWYQPV